MKNELSGNFWRSLSQKHDVSTKKLHDYYFNTFTKLFQASPLQFKEEIYELMKSHLSEVSEGNSGAMFKIVWEYLHKTYPEMDFHYQQTYSLVNKYMVQ